MYAAGRLLLLLSFLSDCPAGGVGVDVWPGKETDPYSSPSLRSVTLVGNGGDGGDGGDGGCAKGGGLLVTATATKPSPSSFLSSPIETGGGGEEGVAAEGATGATSGQGQEGHGPGVSALSLSLSLSGCTIRNNTARSGGGIAIGPVTTASSSSSSSPPAARVSPPSLGTAEKPAAAVAVAFLDGVPPGRQQSGGTAPITGSQGVPDRAPGVPTAETSSEGGGVLLSVVLDGATVVAENRATSGGGVWASGAAVSAVGGQVVVRGNVVGGLEDGCGEEVGWEKTGIP